MILIFDEGRKEMTLKREYLFLRLVSWIKINQYLLEHQLHVESSNQGTINEAKWRGGFKRREASFI